MEGLQGVLPGGSDAGRRLRAFQQGAEHGQQGLRFGEGKRPHLLYDSGARLSVAGWAGPVSRASPLA